MKFSLFYFSNDSNITGQRYKLVLDGAKFADENKFDAIWVPERHFHRFGGLYPNPSILGAAIAATTKHVQVRAGSVVAPLHHPLRVAEEWSVIDNISNGRVGVAFASGWNPNDFIFAPDQYSKRNETLFQTVRSVRDLWMGKEFQGKNGEGSNISVSIYPKPIQPSLPIWIAISNNAQKYAEAGSIGANILTAFWTQGFNYDFLKERISNYRQALVEKRYDSQEGKVTIMLHTFVDKSDSIAKEKVRSAFYEYVLTRFDLLHLLAKSSNMGDIDPDSLSESDKQFVAELAFERYFQNSLIGSVEKCLSLVKKMEDLGVNEVACLVDFGMDYSSVFESFSYLKELKENFEMRATPSL